VVDSSGDVFADLGVTLTGEDAWKVAIAREITAAISRQKMTQAEAASKIGTDQAKVSNLTRGKLDGFSVERLMAYLLRLGFDIDMHISRTPSSKGRVRVHHGAMAL
jgi:predicted XRE-type DNA-binding protein